MEAEGCAASCQSDQQEVPTSWSMYFPQEPFSKEDRRALLIENLLLSFRSPSGKALLKNADVSGRRCVLPVDLQILSQIPDAAEFTIALEFAPYEALTCLAAAAHQALVWESNASCAGPSFEDVAAERIQIRPYNHPDSLLALRMLKAQSIGRFISVRGTVVRVSVVKPIVTGLDFVCQRCDSVQSCQFVDGKYEAPSNCAMDGCRSRQFLPDRESATTVNWQKIRLQEVAAYEGQEEGRIPRTVDCELTADLVDTCVPGDVVTVCGIVKVINTEQDMGGGRAKSKNQALFYLYIDAVSVTSASSQKSGAEEDEDERCSAPPNALTFQPRDLEFVAKYAEEHSGDQFRQLLHSICPAIYGHELVKAGILLALFGGVRKHVRDRNRVPVRGDLHVLVVGDPGLGKSQLLQAAASVAPRGIYVCGNTTTAAGLTVAVVKDGLTGDYTFEAGAIVLADRGLCSIDEFDKMTTEHQALLEAMEQQSVSIAKAGLIASLPARTSVLAAANPVGGHYNRAKTVNENLKLAPALLSRFDLVFILLDKPDEILDQRLSEHVMSLHSKNSSRHAAAKQAVAQYAGNAPQIVDADAPLSVRLKLDAVRDADFAPLPAPLVRKYIAYARQYVFPTMSADAVAVLQAFYLQLRDHSHGADGTPITARQLESLVRLAEARARIELREEITKQDALDVVEIMKESLYDKFTDDHGCVDFGRSSGMSQHKEAKRFLAALQRKSELQQKAVFEISELYMLADDISLRVPDMESFIENLNTAGYLLKKGPRLYQVQSSSHGGTQRVVQSQFATQRR